MADGHPKDGTGDDQAKLLALLDGSPIGVAIVSLKRLQRLYVNDRLVTMFGTRSKRELMDWPVDESWASRAEMDALRAVYERGEVLTDYEVRRRRKDGSIWWTLMNSQWIDFDGEPARVVWHNDITERKRAQEEARDLTDSLEAIVSERTAALTRETAERERSEDQFRHAFESAPVGLALISPEGKRLKVNKALADFLGYSVDELTGMDIFATDADPDAFARSMALRKQLLDGEIVSYANTRTYRHKDGHTVFGEVSASLFRDAQGNPDHIISHTIDITERHKAEAARHKALAQAEQANRAKSDFLAAMSHEFRTPLNAILGFSDVLVHRYLGPADNARYQEYAEHIHDSATHLLELVNDLLDISVIEAGKASLDKQPVSIGAVIEDCTRVIKDRALRKSVALEVDAPADFPDLTADRRAVKQILLNLLSNALKFTPSGGRITVFARDAGDAAAFGVIDTGQGIAPDLLPKITQPYTGGGSPYTSDKGWGLGLAITQSLIDLHDGKMAIESAEGTGTTVTVTLPRS